MAGWLWLLLLLAAAACLATVGRALLRRPRPTAIAEYSSGLTLAGPVTAGRATYVIVQWLSDPADPAPCPLTVHLPAGDLGGEDLCDWAAPQTAAALEGPVQLDLFPFHGGRGRRRPRRATAGLPRGGGELRGHAANAAASGGRCGAPAGRAAATAREGWAGAAGGKLRRVAPPPNPALHPTGGPRRASQGSESPQPRRRVSFMFGLPVVVL
jgi:hypothetical protein